MTLEVQCEVGQDRQRAAVLNTLGADWSCCASTMRGDTHSFRGRCASALTHPVTIAALVVLLLNDALFKLLWPDSWVTGKLSDLAWVVFASPLLVFVLSLFLSRRLFTRRAVVLVSYVGLPALYAAFNTFEPVHDGILWGLSLVAGGRAGSPIDPSDSLVIPFGLGIAVWVWRRRPVGADRLRVRLALLAAGVATFATVATSYPPPDTGIQRVGVAGNRMMFASGRNEDGPFHFRSGNGGLSWTQIHHATNIKWGGLDLDSPRGKFMIQGPRILERTVGDEWTVAYSAAFLQQEANLWIQEQTTSQFGTLRSIGANLYGISYDPRSGNLVVAMGLQGVLIGTSDGKWSRVAVGAYSPNDFSFAGKTLALLSNMSFWLTALSLSLSMTVISLVIALFRRINRPLGIGVTVGTLALWMGLPPALLAGGLLEGAAIAVALLVVATIGLSLRLAYLSEESAVVKGFALAMASMSAIASVEFLLEFGLVNRLFTLGAIPALFAALFAGAAITVCWRHVAHWKAVRIGCTGMIGLIVLVFLVWVQLGFGLPFAKIAAFVLVALVAVALTRHIRRVRQPS